MNKLVTTLICLVVFLILGMSMFFYYIKPQRELIRVGTQKCLDKAMSPIDNEVLRYSSYKTISWFNESLKIQNTEITKCLNNYNTILFSSSEKGLVNLDLDSRLEKQEVSIGSYTKRADGVAFEQRQQRDKQNACQERGAMFSKYNTCMENKRVNDPNYFSEVSSFLLDDSKNPCLIQYNYKQIQVDSFDCIMMGIVTP